MSLSDRQAEMRERMMKHRMRQYRHAAALPVPIVSTPEDCREDLQIHERAGEGRLKFPKKFHRPSKEHTINVAKRGYLFSPVRTSFEVQYVEINRTLLLELIRIAEEAQ